MSLNLPDVQWAAVDTESSGLFADDGARVACAAIAWMEDGQVRSRAFPFDQGLRDKFAWAQMDLFEQDVDPNLSIGEWSELLNWLASLKLIVMHNAKHDLSMFRAGTRHWVGMDLYPAAARGWKYASQRIWDTLIGSRHLDPRERAGLDEVAKRLEIGQKNGTEEIQAWLRAFCRAHRMKYDDNKGRYDLVPWGIVGPYVTVDAEMAALVYEDQFARFSAGEADFDRMDREMELLGVLYEMEGRGVGYDSDASLEVADVLERRIVELAKTLPFEVTPRGANRYFYGEMALPPERFTDAGRPCLDEEQVRRWVTDRVPWAFEYMQVVRAKRTVSMYYRGYPEKAGLDGRLRCSFKQTQVRTGRFSVERINLQAIPKAARYVMAGTDERLPIYEGIKSVRDLIRAREGYGLWSLDLSQAELRIATKFSGCIKMGEMLANGVDMHGYTAEDVLKARRERSTWKASRDVAKQANFAGIFLVGPRTFQETLSSRADIHLPLDECERIVRSWRNTYPEFGIAYRSAMIASGRRGYVRLLPNTPYEIRSWFLERELWFDHRLGMAVAKESWNRIVQGSLAEGFRLLLALINRRFPGILILTVHDSVVIEALLDEGEEIAKEICMMSAKFMTELYSTPMSMDMERMV